MLAIFFRVANRTFVLLASRSMPAKRMADVATWSENRLSHLLPFTFPGFPACAKLPHRLFFIFFME